MKSKNQPFFLSSGISILLFLISVFGIMIQVISETGLFTYGLDDTYIHLTLARNWAETGIPGINPGEFCLASSSPVYTGFLALIHWSLGEKIAHWTPLIINLLAGAGLLAWIAYILSIRNYSFRSLLLWTLAFIPIAVLPSLALSGMEHLLHGCVFAMAMYLVSQIISAQQSVDDLFWPLLIVMLLMGGIRYEGLAGCGLMLGIAFLMRPSWKLALIGVVAALPIVLISWYNWIETGFILPNSVFMKLNPPTGILAELGGIKRFVAVLGGNLKVSGFIMMGLVSFGSLFLFRQFSVKDWRKDPGQIYLLLFLVLCLLHSTSATTIVLRYEAYLVIGWLVGIALVSKEVLSSLGKLISSSRERYTALGVALLLGGALSLSFVYLYIFEPLKKSGLPNRNIHDQQYMMKEFVSQYHPGSTVAINDLGLMGYGGKVSIIDLEGLGSSEITNLNRQGEYSWEAIQTILDERGVDLMIVYEKWYEEAGLTKEGRVATWKLEDDYILGDGTVSFFSRNEDFSAQLQAELKSFEPQLPARVIVNYDPLP